MNFKITYSPTIDAGYIYVEDRGAKSVAYTHSVLITSPDHNKSLGDVNIDVGHDGQVIGFEILGVSQIMPSLKAAIEKICSCGDHTHNDDGVCNTCRIVALFKEGDK